MGEGGRGTSVLCFRRGVEARLRFLQRIPLPLGRANPLGRPPLVDPRALDTPLPWAVVVLCSGAVFGVWNLAVDLEDTMGGFSTNEVSVVLYNDMDVSYRGGRPERGLANMKVVSPSASPMDFSRGLAWLAAWCPVCVARWNDSEMGPCEFRVS